MRTFRLLAWMVPICGLWAADPDGATPLHWAAYRDDVPAVERLLKTGADANAVNRYGVAPLSLACTNGSASVVELLLNAGADPNKALPGGETPLMTASRTVEGGSCTSAARPRRKRECQRIVAGPDRLDVGGRRRECRDHQRASPGGG